MSWGNVNPQWPTNQRLDRFFFRREWSSKSKEGKALPGEKSLPLFPKTFQIEVKPKPLILYRQLPFPIFFNKLNGMPFSRIGFDFKRRFIACDLFIACFRQLIRNGSLWAFHL